jgi:hypothetical protein
MHKLVRLAQQRWGLLYDFSLLPYIVAPAKGPNFAKLGPQAHFPNFWETVIEMSFFFRGKEFAS